MSVSVTRVHTRSNKGDRWPIEVVQSSEDRKHVRDTYLTTNLITFTKVTSPDGLSMNYTVTAPDQATFDTFDGDSVIIGIRSKVTAYVATRGLANPFGV